MKLNIKKIANLIRHMILINNLLPSSSKRNSKMQVQYLKVCLIVVLCCQMSLAVRDSICDATQKAFYMSYNSISKRDTIGNIFVYINSITTSYNESYDNGAGTNYKVTNFHPQFYYNQHHQVQTFVNSSTVNVLLGDVVYVASFNYSITKNGTTKTGFARAEVLAEQHIQFVKMLMVIDQYLEWTPTQISDIIFLSIMQIAESTPKLLPQQINDLQLFIDDMTNPNANIKGRAVTQLNTLYKNNLKIHLNTQQIIGVNSINYRYGGIQINFNNNVKNYTLSNDQIKGLKAYFHWEVQDSTQDCTTQHFTIDQYGGHQQWYSLTSLKFALISALQKGVANVTVNRNYEVPQFQFYMGDLSNSVDQALNYPADTPLTVTCSWSGDQNNVKLEIYDRHDLSVVFSQVCVISGVGRPLLQVSFDVYFVIRVSPLNEVLMFSIGGANSQMPVYKSLDPKFIVTNPNIARFSLARVIAGLQGRQVFGTGYKISYRNFPAVDINNEYMIVFDPSQV